MPGEAARSQGQASGTATSTQGAPRTASDMPGFSDDDQLRIALMQPIVEREAAAHGLDPELVNAVIWVESRFRPEAKSSAGARGLMQLMPATAAHLAKQLGERRPKAHDPEFNIKAGSYYLSRLLERFDGDERLAVAAYNAGPGNVAKWQSQGKELPDYSRSYVSKVNEARARFGQHASQSATVAPLMPASKDGEEPNATIASAAPEAPSALDPAADALAVVPEPAVDPTFDTPIFEPSPQLDREGMRDAPPAHPVAVSDTRGHWPLRHVPKAPPTAAPTPNAAKATPDATPDGEHKDLPADRKSVV